MGAPRKYPQELMERGVRMVLESGRSVRSVAGDLGIHPEALRMWVKKARADATPEAMRVLPSDAERPDPQRGHRSFRGRARSDAPALTRIVDALRTKHGVGLVCRVITFPQSTYWHRKHRERDPSPRTRRDVVLVAQIVTARSGTVPPTGSAAPGGS